MFENCVCLHFYLYLICAFCFKTVKINEHCILPCGSSTFLNSLSDILLQHKLMILHTVQHAGINVIPFSKLPFVYLQCLHDKISAMYSINSQRNVYSVRNDGKTPKYSGTLHPPFPQGALVRGMDVVTNREGWLSSFRYYEWKSVL